MKQGDYGTTTLISSAARTATFNSGSESVEPFVKVWGYLNVTAVTGTSPTLDVKVQESVDGSEWYDSGYAFSQVTATGKQRLAMEVGGYYVRAVCTIAGTTPSFTFSLDVVGKQN